MFSFIQFLVWYMFGSDSINTEIALTTVYFSLAAWLGVIQEVYWKDLSWFKQLLLQIIIPLALMVPFVFFSNYDLVSTQSAWLFAFAAVSGFLSFLIPVILSRTLRIYSRIVPYYYGQNYQIQINHC